MAAVIGLKDTAIDRSASGVLFTDRRDFYISPQTFAELYPDVAPFTTVLNRLPTKGNPADPEFKMFEHRSMVHKMDFFIGQAINWDSGSWDATEANVVVELTAGGSDDVGFLVQGDIVEVRAGTSGVRNTGDGSATKDLSVGDVVCRFLVTTVDTQQQVDIEAMSYAGNDIYDVVDQDYARVISNAQPEGHGSPNTWSDELTVVWGQTQIIKTSVGMTGTLANARLRGAAEERSRLRAEKMKEHKIKQENMYLKGYMMKPSTSSRATQGYAFVNPVSTDVSYGKAWRTSWGVIPLLETYGTADEQLFDRDWATYDVDGFIDDMQARKQYFEGGIMNEFALVGSKVLAELSKTGKNSFFARSGGSISISPWQMTNLGFQVRTLTHPFGQLNMVLTPSLLDAPFNNMMVVADLNNVQKVIYRPSAYQTGMADNDYDGFKDQYFSDEGLGLTLIEKHALWRFK